MEKRLFGPLRDVFDEVDVYFHTYRHASCRAKDDRLVEFLKPVAYHFTDEASDGPFPRIIDSYILVLELVFAASAHFVREIKGNMTLSVSDARKDDTFAVQKLEQMPDVIIMCRFDVVYR